MQSHCSHLMKAFRQLLSKYHSSKSKNSKLWHFINHIKAIHLSHMVEEYRGGLLCVVHIKPGGGGEEIKQKQHRLEGTQVLGTITTTTKWQDENMNLKSPVELPPAHCGACLWYTWTWRGAPKINQNKENITTNNLFSRNSIAIFSDRNPTVDNWY